MNLRKSIAALGVVAALAVPLTACSAGGGSAETSSPEASAVMTGATADIAFAQGMIPHHQQAVAMAQLALDPRSAASPQVKALAEQIKGAQDPEIRQMTEWLQQWGAPTTMPGASNDMSGMDHSGHDMGGITMSGMMTPEQMEQLSAATGAEFDTMWLQMMIAHHEGAITMAEQVKAGSTNPDVTALADAIITGQRAEIESMRKDLAQ